MADTYTDPNINSAGQTTKLVKTLGAGANSLVLYRATFETAVADAAADVKRIFKDVPGNLIPISCKIGSDGIAGANDVSLGLFKSNFGAVVSASQFAASMDLSMARGLQGGGGRWTQQFAVRDADETAADSTTFKCLIAPGRLCKVVGAFAIAETAPTVGTDTIQFNRGSSAGATLLNAANVNANSLTANQVTAYTLTATTADLIINASGANSAVYAAYVAGAQTVDAVAMTLGVIFEDLANGFVNIDIADCQKSLWDLAGATVITQKPAYDIGFTLNSEVTAVGTISVEMLFAQS